VALLPTVTRLYLQFHFFPSSFGCGEEVRHHERCFTAVAELNITNLSIPIYVGRNLFHKDTRKLLRSGSKKKLASAHEVFFIVSNSKLIKHVICLYPHMAI
jgi:hypothetical protein